MALLPSTWLTQACLIIGWQPFLFWLFEKFRGLLSGSSEAAFFQEDKRWILRCSKTNSKSIFPATNLSLRHESWVKRQLDSRHDRHFISLSISTVQLQPCRAKVAWKCYGHENFIPNKPHRSILKFPCSDRRGQSCGHCRPSRPPFCKGTRR